MKTIELIVSEVKNIKHNKPLLIAIDGIDAAGKTIFADKINNYMQDNNIFNSVCISIDKFHNPNEIRYRRGKLSPKGFFRDSFNYKAIIDNIIKPIKQEKEHIIAGIYDYKKEKLIEKKFISVNSDTIVLFDGIFLNRDELYKFWDLSVFLQISFKTMLKRALDRDLELFGSEKEVIEKYTKRYIPGEKLYLKKCNPIEKANIVIDNNDYNNPIVLSK